MEKIERDPFKARQNISMRVDPERRIDVIAVKKECNAAVLPYPVVAIIDAFQLSVQFPALASSVRVLSLCRILRVFKVTRNFDGAKVLFVTVKQFCK